METAPDGEAALSKNFTLRLIVPGLLQGKAQTFVSPMLPIFVVELGGSHGMVGLIASAYPIAQCLGSTPVGLVMKHLHNSFAACLALALMVTTALLSFAAQSVYALLSIRLVGGLGATSFDIAQKAYISAEVPPAARGRIAAQIAGFQKLAIMIAALLSGVVAEHLATRSIFLVQASLTLSALLLIAGHSLYLHRKSDLESSEEASHEHISMRVVLREHWRGLVGAGLYCAMLNGVRNTWMVALPLRARTIGFRKMGIGATVAWYRGCDALVTTFAAGHIMDKYGLKTAAVPSMVLMSLAFTLLAAAQGPLSLGLVAVVFGVGNGICGGVLNAFAASLTPPNARTQFLGLWKTVTSLGGIVVPPFFGLVSDHSTLDIAGFCISGAALCTVLWTIFMVTDVKEVPRGAARAAPVAPLNAERNVAVASSP